MKYFKFIIIFLSLFLLFSCVENNEEDPVIEEPDKIAPLITLDKNYEEVSINQNEDINVEEFLLMGLKAIDNIDGNITNKIIVGAPDFDISIPGEYIIFYHVYDSSNNRSEVVMKKITVKEHYGLIASYPVYQNAIDGENLNVVPQLLFGGAWYHKVVSSVDKWVGIEGIITLPQMEIKRYEGNFKSDVDVDFNSRNLDNPSIYLGGNASYESDVGLSLSKVLIKNNLGQMVLSTGSLAFRPFWRYITTPGELNKDLGGYDLENNRRYAVGSTNASETNMIANWYYGDTEYYYLPGDKLRIIVYSPKPNFLQLQIEVIEKSSLPYSVDLRETNGWKDPENFLSPIFPSTNHGSNKNAEFKRVNAIDQVANEGKNAIMTESNVKEAIWEGVYLHRVIDGILYRVPFNEIRSNTLSAPDKKYFTYTKIDELTGGSTVIIHPNREND